MGAARSAIGHCVDAAIAATSGKGQPMTPSNVWANCKTAGLHMRLTRAEVDRIVDQAVQRHIPIRLKSLGHLIANATSRERVPFGECSTLEIAVQVDIRADSIAHDKAQHRALVKTQRLLVLKSKRAGRQVTAGEERPAIVKIYAAEGLGPPPGL